MIKRLAFATPLLMTSLGTAYLGALMIVVGLHGVFSAGLILTRRD